MRWRLLDGVPDEEIRRLLSVARRRTFRKGEVVFHRGLPVEQRVLRRLAELADVYGDGNGEVVIPLTQEELAGLAGTSRATVNEVLRAHQERGLVELRRGRTIVPDTAVLAARIR
jgi:CRP-like cAMP-binding protein